MNFDVYYPADVMQLIGASNSETLRRKIKEGKIPPPDVRISQKIRYWHRASLIKAGLLAKNK
jgi:hypothetical protein